MSSSSWILSNSKTMQRYGLSYYIATLFFPARQKKDVFVLYKFVRIPDLIVDTNTLSREQSREQLAEFRDHRKQCYAEKKYADPLLGEVAKLWHEYDIPLSRTEDFLAAMYQDTFKDRYASYEDLQKYMYGSAEVVGLMMCKILHIPEIAYPYARALGEAMQLTNFLRDVREDRCEYKRIYIPQDILNQNKLSEDSIIDRSDHPPLQLPIAGVHLFQQLIQKADALYDEAALGYKYIPSHFRRPIMYASRMYQAILRKIEKKHYNVFLHSTRTHLIEKVSALLR